MGKGNTLRSDVRNMLWYGNFTQIPNFFKTIIKRKYLKYSFLFFANATLRVTSYRQRQTYREITIIITQKVQQCSI